MEGLGQVWYRGTFRKEVSGLILLEVGSYIISSYLSNLDGEVGFPRDQLPSNPSLFVGEGWGWGWDVCLYKNFTFPLPPPSFKRNLCQISGSLSTFQDQMWGGGVFSRSVLGPNLSPFVSTRSFISVYIMYLEEGTLSRPGLVSTDPRCRVGVPLHRDPETATFTTFSPRTSFGGHTNGIGLHPAPESHSMGSPVVTTRKGVSRLRITFLTNRKKKKTPM